MTLEALEPPALPKRTRAVRTSDPTSDSDVLLILVGLTTPADERVRTEADRLKSFRSTSPRLPLTIASATADSPSTAVSLLRKYKPAAVHFRKFGNDAISWLDEDGELHRVLTEENVRCVLFEDCYELTRAEIYSHKVPNCIGINGRFSDQFLSTFYARFERNASPYELYNAAEWSFFNHHPETSKAKAEERPYFITRNLGALKSGQASILTDSPGYGVAGKLLKPNEPSRTPSSCLLHFGTNRKPNHPGDPTEGFSGERDSTTHFGTCRIVVPLHHKIGSLGIPEWKQIFRSPEERDEEFQMDLAEIRSLTEELYWASLRSSVSGLVGQDDSVVYIHGYNVSFRDAALRAAQLAVDLKIKTGMNFFSWPSKGKFPAYTMDEASIEGSEKALTAYLAGLLRAIGDKRVHVIAHSMGNRGVLRAMQNLLSLAEQRAGAGFGQIVLAAPDVDIELFNDLAGAYKNMSKRTTLYVSSKDRALGVSGIVHDCPRAGYTPPVTIVPDIDTIETSSVDLTFLGHGYYADARSVLEDIFSVLRTDETPDDRFGPKRATYNGQDYWIIGA